MTYREQLIRAATGRVTPFEFDGVTYLLRPLTQGELLSLPEAGRESMNAVFALVVCDDEGRPVFAPEDVAAMPEGAIYAVAQEAFRRCSPDPKGGAAKP